MDLCREKHPDLDNGNTRYYMHTLGGLQKFTKHSDEEISEQIYGILGNQFSPEAKQLQAKTMENIFQKILEFDESKAEYSSLKDIWNDDKYEDFQIMSSSIWDSDTPVSNYQKLIDDPTVDTKLDDNMLKEVVCKLKVFNGSSGFCLGTDTVGNALTGKFSGDYDIDKILNQPYEKLADAATTTGDPFLSEVFSIKTSSTKGFGLVPGMKFGDAVQFERDQRGLKKFKNDEERKERYNDILNVLKDNSPEASQERIKKKQEKARNEEMAEWKKIEGINEYTEAVRNMAIEAQKKLDELAKHPKSGRDSETFTNMRDALQTIADFRQDIAEGKKADDLKVNAALDTLKTTSEAYTAAHTGWRHPFSGNTEFGKKRIESSRDFAEFAAQQKEALAPKTQSFRNDKNKNEPIENVIKAAEDKIDSLNTKQNEKAVNKPIQAVVPKLLVSPEQFLELKVANAQENMKRANPGKMGVVQNYQLEKEYATIATAAHLRHLQKKDPNYKVTNKVWDKNYETMIGDKSFKQMMKYGDPEKLFNAASTGNGGLLYEELKNAMKTRKAEEDLQNNNKQPTVNNNKEKTFEAKKK